MLARSCCPAPAGVPALSAAAPAPREAGLEQWCYLPGRDEHVGPDSHSCERHSWEDTRPLKRATASLSSVPSGGAGVFLFVCFF